MSRFFTLVFVAVVAVSALAQTEIKGNPEDLRQFLHPSDKVVTISGHAYKKAYSDKAIVSLVITTEHKALAEAISANSKLRDTISAKLSAAGISKENIKSSKFSTSPQYGWFGKKPDSYKVVNRMAININDEAHMREIAAVADTYKEIEFSDTAFEHSKEDEFMEKVKSEALDKVMQQKSFYEKTLGIKLSPVGFRDQQVGRAATRGALVLEEVVVQGFRSGGESYQPKAKARNVGQTQETSFDEIKYEATVSVDFKVINSNK